MLSADSQADVMLGLWKNIGLTNLELPSSVRSLVTRSFLDSKKLPPFFLNWLLLFSLLPKMFAMLHCGQTTCAVCANCSAMSSRNNR